MRPGWRWVVAGLTVVAVAGVVAWSFTPSGTAWWQQALEGLGGAREPDPDQLTQVSRQLAAATAEELERAKNNVHAIHERMNQITGWGHLSALRDAQSPAWAEVEAVLTGATAQFLREVAPRLQPSTVGRDLEAFFWALEQGYRQRQAGLIRTAHRIIHDLDYFVFNHKTVPGGSRDYWAATLTLEGEDSLASDVLGAAAREAGAGTEAGKEDEGTGAPAEGAGSQ
ncbi:hypothetical protein DYI95_009740 [Thermaerobacter sp. PB12/4term]|uniref:hypothetical protein n=1 Tax=Thermaerobacter sp. PB12/4term TaxID=2293838 RepID=UPI000E326490|nr:hypothetical protein [Thermaerobacter sp. PB12/4term]QIA27753.1 hypothetical protein DYI95_009740 [Thermaerobacter sp. PB12/4term]